MSHCGHRLMSLQSHMSKMKLPLHIHEFIWILYIFVVQQCSAWLLRLDTVLQSRFYCLFFFIYISFFTTSQRCLGNVCNKIIELKMFHFDFAVFSVNHWLFMKLFSTMQEILTPSQINGTFISSFAKKTTL